MWRLWYTNFKDKWVFKELSTAMDSTSLHFWYSKVMSEANELTSKILDFLYRNGVYGWRSSSTGLFDLKLGKFRTSSKVGVSDILAILPPVGKLLAIEVKVGADRLRPEQIGFFRNVEHVGGLTFVAKDFESFRSWFNQTVPHG